MIATRFLLDANLSPATGRFLTDVFGLDVVDLYQRGLGRPTDHEIVDMAIREQRVIITFDLDFGEIYNRGERGRLGSSFSGSTISGETSWTRHWTRFCAIMLSRYSWNDRSSSLTERGFES